MVRSESIKFGNRNDSKHCFHQAGIREHGFVKDTRSRWVDPKSRRNRPYEGAYSPSKATEDPQAMLSMSAEREGVRTPS